MLELQSSVKGQDGAAQLPENSPTERKPAETPAPSVRSPSSSATSHLRHTHLHLLDPIQFIKYPYSEGVTL
jgi:hypothetical protein